jgi:AcrR family transcriptional regulator
MIARAETAELTRSRILGAATELISERFLDDISLEDIADRAGVSVRTVIRRFGSRSSLIKAGVDEANMLSSSRLDGTAPGDVGDAVDSLFDDYESWGDPLLMLLAQEQRHDELRPLLEAGRVMHGQWVRRVFCPRDEIHAAQLVAVTDVYVWKLLRRDIGLSPEAVRRAIKDMIERLVA